MTHSRHFGDWVLRPSLHFLAYQAKLRSGWLRLRTPAGSWRGWASFESDLGGLGTFPIPTVESLRKSLDELPESARRQAIETGEDLLQGRFQAFGCQPIEAGFPPDWGAFLPLVPRTPAPIPSDSHWSNYQLDTLGGDVKLVWELSRFGWVYGLGRAYLLGVDDRYAEAFWALLTSWREDNPPNLGLQWASGQEVGLRLMALVYAWRAFEPWLVQQTGRRAVLLETIEAHAKRLPPSLDYALAQDNNHLLVEAAALMTTGLAFPGFRSADVWRSKGRGLLVAAVTRQFFGGGGYCQHSVNYARVAIEAVLWAAVAASRAHQPLPPPVLTALSQAADWLSAMMIGKDGQTPNFGPNDGAQILPLTACDYEDFRPTLDAVRRLTGGPPLDNGPWRELGDWLGLPRPEFEVA